MRKSEGWNEKKHHEHRLWPLRNSDHLGIRQNQEQHIRNKCENQSLCGIHDYNQSSAKELEHKPSETLRSLKTIRIEKANWVLHILPHLSDRSATVNQPDALLPQWSRAMRLILHGMHKSWGKGAFSVLIFSTEGLCCEASLFLTYGRLLYLFWVYEVSVRRCWILFVKVSVPVIFSVVEIQCFHSIRVARL